MMGGRDRDAGALSPISIIRAIVMDLGFAGLIEKIEDRFGKWLGTLLMGALAFVVLAFTVDMLVSISASLRATEGLSHVLGDMLLAAAILLTVGLPILAILDTRQRRRAERYFEVQKKLLEEAITEYTKILETNREVRDETQRLLDAVREYHPSVRQEAG